MKVCAEVATVVAAHADVYWSTSDNTKFLHLSYCFESGVLKKNILEERPIFNFTKLISMKLVSSNEKN